MDRFARLIGFVAVVVLALLPGASWAVDAVGPTPVRTYTGSCGGKSITGILEAFLSGCTAAHIAAQTTNGTYDSCPVRFVLSGSFSVYSEYRNNSTSGGASFWFAGKSTYTATHAGGATCNTTGSYNVAGVYASATWVEELGCEAGSHKVSGGLCGCDVGYNVQSGKCKQYTCPPSGSYSAVTQPDQKVANAGDGQCSGGCGYTPSSWKVGNDGQIWATWPFKSTGKFCGGDPKPGTTDVDSGEQNTKNPAPVPCGTNQCPGTVNGQAICVPCKGQQEQGPSTSASAPAGAASGTQTGTSDTSTTCNGVNCTTTTTTKDANGTVTGTVEKSEKQESFCKENPTSALCKQSSFGGQCGAVTCEGDAVQCAIAADQYRRNCQWFDDEAATQLATVGNAAITGQSRPDGHPANNPDAQSVSFSSAIDQSDRLGGGCPVDVAVNVAGKSVAIPFSSMCGNLQLVGNLMVGFCMFVAALIVFRS